MDSVALFLHLLGAFCLVAGTVVAGVAFETARRRQGPREIALLLGLSRIGVALVGTGTLLAVVFGLWLVHLGGWGFGAGWVSAAIALLVVTLICGALGGQLPKRARLLAAREAERGDAASASPELRRLLDDRRALALNYLAAALLLAIVALMVFKPGAGHT